MEPYAARLACMRGSAREWDVMEQVLAESADAPGDAALLEVDRRCHEIIWHAAGNRFLTDTLDVLYAQSDRVWHMYLADVVDTRHAVDEHIDILEALRSGDPDAAAASLEAHVKEFDQQVRHAVTTRLDPPLAG
jgi:DNA-binding GntR family transcriptional regulator